MISAILRRIGRLRPAATIGLAAIALTAFQMGAQAQISSETQSAMRANCRSDFMSLCSGVSPGGKDALTCLQTNVSKLSSACEGVVRSTLPPPAKPAQSAPAPAKPAQAPAPAKPAPAAAAAPAAPTAAQQNALKSSCRSDFMAKCSGVSPGGKDALACLQRNQATLSPACGSAVAAIGGAPAPAATGPVPPAPVGVPTDAAAGPTPQQIAAIKNTCRGDFRSFCRGVPQGGQEAIACLMTNQARLSPNCKISVADIAASMPADAPPAAAAAPVATAPLKQPNVVDAAVMLRACKLDLVRHCNRVEPGGGRALACLNQHADNLTFRCRTAMKVTAPLR